MLAARDISAASSPTRKAGRGLGHSGRKLRAARLCMIFLGCLPAVLCFSAAPSIAASNKVRVTALSDVSFGTVANLSIDSIANQSVCIFADTVTNGYNVTASGAGPGGSFVLSSGAATLAYDVQWSSSPGQSTGATLSANVPLTGQVSSATQQSCSSGPASSASLIVVLRSAALSSAAAGTYSGNLTLVIGAE